MHYSNTLVSVQIKFDYETPPDKVHFSDLEHALVNQHLMSRLSIFYKTDRKSLANVRDVTRAGPV